MNLKLRQKIRVQELLLKIATFFAKEAKCRKYMHLGLLFTWQCDTPFSPSFFNYALRRRMTRQSHSHPIRNPIFQYGLTCTSNNFYGLKFRAILELNLWQSSCFIKWFPLGENYSKSLIDYASKFLRDFHTLCDLCKERFL